MVRIFLQDKIEEAKRFGDLPVNWNSFNLENFSKNKRLCNQSGSSLHQRNVKKMEQM